MLEVLYAGLLTVSGFCAFVAVIAGLGLLVAGIIGLFNLVGSQGASYESERKEHKEYLILSSGFIKKLILVVVVMGIPALTPSPNDLFEIRIGLLKFHAVSPQNLEKFAKYGMPHIERMAKKIECKYLGCEDGKAKTSEVSAATKTPVVKTEDEVLKAAIQDKINALIQEQLKIGK